VDLEVVVAETVVTPTAGNCDPDAHATS